MRLKGRNLRAMIVYKCIESPEKQLGSDLFLMQTSELEIMGICLGYTVQNRKAKSNSL